MKAAVIVIIFRMMLLFSVLLIRPPFYLLAAAVLVFDQSFKAMSDPLLFNYIHKFIPTKIRATVISIKSMGVQIVGVLSALFAGVLQDILGPQIVLVLGGLFGFFAIATFLKIKD
jgi:predicted MFS family arabinose efflux permease